MTKQELNTLSDLLLKLQNERLQEYRDEGQDVDSMDDKEIMELERRTLWLYHKIL